MRLLMIAAAAALLTGPAAAADSWGLDNEQELQVQGIVVDVLCELNGECPENCGGGTRQLGLLTEDGRLLLAAKSNTLFAGPVLDLLPHCGERVEADGLLIENPAMTVYFVQYLRTDPAAEFVSTDAYGEEFTATHGEADEWFRAHPQVVEEIEQNGPLGRPELSLEE